MTDSRTRLALADDHESVRHALRLLIDQQADMQVIGEASDAPATVRLALEQRPEVIVVDLAMPQGGGLSVLEQLRAAHFTGATVAFTAHEDPVHLYEALRLGVTGYVAKRSPASELLQAIRSAARGRPFLDTLNTAHVMRGYSRQRVATPQAAAGERAEAVLRQVALGYTAKEIAASLRVSVKTVEAEKARAMQQLGLRDRVDIVRYAIIHGWLRELEPEV